MGNKTKLLGPWMPSKKGGKDEEVEVDEDHMDDDPSKNQACVPSMLQIVKTQESLAAWRKRVRGPLTIKQLETCHIISKGKVSIPERSRQHFPGTNCGDTLTDVNIPHPDDVWRLSKKALCGKTEVDGPHEKRSPETIEPVIYHPMPSKFYSQLLDDFYVKRVIDLVACDGMFAYACLKHRVGYVGICFTQEHASLLEEMFIAKLKVDMAVVGDPLYNPQYAMAIGEKTEKEEADDGPPSKKRRTAAAKAAAEKEKA